MKLHEMQRMRYATEAHELIVRLEAKVERMRATWLPPDLRERIELAMEQMDADVRRKKIQRRAFKAKILGLEDRVRELEYQLSVARGETREVL